MAIHPQIPSFSDNVEIMDKPEKWLKPGELVYESGNSIQIGIILMGPIAVPYCEDGVASDCAFTPLDIENKEEWKNTFDGYIVFDIVKQNYQICNSLNLYGFEKGINEGYIPFDLGTGQLRAAFGLIKLAEKWYGKSATGILEKFLKNQPGKEDGNSTDKIPE